VANNDPKVLEAAKVSAMSQFQSKNESQQIQPPAEESQQVLENRGRGKEVGKSRSLGEITSTSTTSLAVGGGGEERPCSKGATGLRLEEEMVRFISWS
jgi:hypothetical protein